VAVDPSDENHMLVTSSNYGVTQVYETTNALAGSPTWTAVDGNLPDMPVRWAMFDPRNSDWALLATELGIWSTDNINGASTDWDPTNTGLANVRVDMLQYRASDRVIAAATHGRGLFTAPVPNVTTPDVNFNAATSSATEQTTATTSCRNYTDYNVVMTIANPPTGNATITVNLQGGGTATQGVDFDFTTNGNFAAPSNTFIFANGATTPQNIAVRVYDDEEIEPAESFTLSYAISGTTNAQTGTGPQLHTFTITSDDAAPLPGITGNFLIGTYNANLGNTTAFRANKQRHRLQTLFTAAELNAAGLNSSTYLTSMIMRVVTKASTTPYVGFTVSIGHTNATTLASGFQAPAFTQVFSADYTTVTGDNTINFTTPFLYNGTSNIIVQFCFDNGATAPAGAADVMEGNTAPLGAGIRASTYSDWVSGGGTGCTLGAAFISDFRLNATFVASGTTIATGLNTSRSEYLGPNSDVYFYSNTGELLARVRNLTSHDYGCTQVVIDRAGTGASQFWNNYTANYLMNKTFRIIPTTNNAAGQFEVTLYYSQAEVNGWQTATGQSFSSILLVKVPSQISNVTPANPHPDGAGTTQVVVPTRGTFGVHSTITHTFTNGFSGFGAGVPGGALPVTLLDFKGQVRNSSAVLDWKTSSEHNSKGFEVERSYDGTNFTRIGFIAAAGNSNAERNYQFTDKDIAQDNNYYRLKMVDLDNRFVHSKSIVLNYEPTGKSVVRVLTNPVQSNLDIEFANIPNSDVTVRLVDLNGRVLKSWQKPQVAQRRIRFNLSGTQMAKGVYMVNITLNGKNYTERILKD
jgi:trimeric autotransporter adhesin